ncbi:MAG TPA: phosphoribosylglycinamide formyltransferase [Chthonomonadaceae bacterium]|nr:phosphoribosylglycinamide formyltransferase [Chthonomonadaceae bacterium]
MTSRAPLAIAGMVSGQGRGTNLGALLEACASGQIAGRFAVVIGTRADAPALERARAVGVAVSVISPRKYEGDEEGYAEALLRVLKRHEVGLICLAGYMRRLPPAIVSSYAGRIMNVHPALLPLFGGRGMYGEHVQQAVLESGMKVSGATVHFVDEEYDTGPIIVQYAAPVLEDDTPATLGARILREEHRAYVRAVQLFADHRLRVEGRRVVVLPEAMEAETSA